MLLGMHMVSSDLSALHMASALYKYSNWECIWLQPCIWLEAYIRPSVLRVGKSEFFSNH